MLAVSLAPAHLRKIHWSLISSSDLGSAIWLFLATCMRTQTQAPYPFPVPLSG
jgi:hypothetical protein